MILKKSQLNPLVISARNMGFSTADFVWDQVREPYSEESAQFITYQAIVPSVDGAERPFFKIEKCDFEYGVMFASSFPYAFDSCGDMRGAQITDRKDLQQLFAEWLIILKSEIEDPDLLSLVGIDVAYANSVIDAILRDSGVGPSDWLSFDSQAFGPGLAALHNKIDAIQKSHSVSVNFLHSLADDIAKMRNEQRPGVVNTMVRTLMISCVSAVGQEAARELWEAIFATNA